MDTVTIIFKICGGLVLFMFSIKMLSDAMKRSVGSLLKTILEKATANPLTGIAAGTFATFLLQSSSVTVLLLLGLVNAGVMKLNQAIYIILGSEIGTTITAQIVAFKVTVMYFPFIICGFVLRSVLNHYERARNICDVIFCLGLVFFAMNIMTEGASPLKDFPLVMQLFGQFGSSPLSGILIGTIFTAITSSSSATTSLVIAMSMDGVIGLSSGIAVIVGANIGTCVLELIAIVGASDAAKRTGIAQFIINMTGALLIYPLLQPFAGLISMTADTVPRQLANGHTIFNIAVSFLLLPFTPYLIRLLEVIVPGTKQVIPEMEAMLDKRLLNVPALALGRVEEETLKMLSLAKEMLTLAGKAFFERDQDACRMVKKYEQIIDSLHGTLIAYCSQISSVLLSNADIRRKRAIANSLPDIERIADLAENLVFYAEQPDINISQNAKNDLKNIFDNALIACKAALEAMRETRKIVHTDVRNIETHAENLKLELRRKFISRQAKESGKPAIDAFYPEILRDLERIASHSFNIIEHFENLKE